MKFRNILCAVIMMAAAISCTEKTEDNNFTIKRGTNLSHWLSQSFDRGEIREKKVTEEDIIRLKEYGFDHVRIPVDEVQFWNEQGEKEPEAWTILTNVLDWCVAHDMRAIVDLHIIRSHNFNASNSGGHNTLFESEEEQDRLVDFWRQFSEVLKDYPNKYVAYEFMNEPVADNPEDWNRIIAKVHKALRELEPNRTLVVGSNMWQSVSTFGDLKVPEGDPHILLSCHFYEPMLLTHYRASWNEFIRYSGPVHYPGVMVTEEEFDVLTEEEKSIVNKFTTVWDKDRLKEMIRPAAEYAKAHGLPLYCGEWGVYGKAPREDAYNWYRDVISIFDEFDMAWSTWCYYSEFGFWNWEKQEITDQPMLDILLSGKSLQDSGYSE